MKAVRRTAAQPLTRYLSARRNEERAPLVPGIWAIFGHGNVAGIGDALAVANLAGTLPTYRAHSEQGMANAEIAYAKAKNRTQFMAVPEVSDREDVFQARKKYEAALKPRNSI